MPYPYLGTGTLIYTQYTSDGKTLVAQPGGLYNPLPVPGTEGLPVPPGDGRWGEWQEPAKEPADKNKPAPKARAGKTAAPAAGGE